MGQKRWTGFIPWQNLMVILYPRRRACTVTKAEVKAWGQRVFACLSSWPLWCIWYYWPTWHWSVWEEPVVICGKWNIRQVTLQQVFKVTTFCTDTCFQSFSPLIYCIVHHALLKFSPCRNKTLPQPSISRIDGTWYAWKIEKMKNLCIWQSSAVTFSGVVDAGVTVCFLLR